MSSNCALISVHGLCESNGDFEVAAGEVFGLPGLNGAGKITTVEILEGSRPRSEGEASVPGFDGDGTRAEGPHRRFSRNAALVVDRGSAPSWDDSATLKAARLPGPGITSA